MSYLLTDPDLSAEQSIIAACLITPAKAGDVLVKLVPDDFNHPLHVRIMHAISGLASEGRTPSIQSIAEAVGPDEIEPGLTAIGYLRSLIGRHIPDMVTPIDDAVETVHDAAMRRNLALAGSLLAERAKSPLMSAADAARDGMAAIDGVLSSLRQTGRRTYDAGGSAFGVFEHLAQTDNRYPTSGIASLDEKLGGWPIAQLSIAAGRPGMGKSAFACGAVLRAAQSGDGVAFFSLEMQREQIGARFMADLCFDDGHAKPVLYKDLLTRKLYPGTRSRLDAAYVTLKELPIVIDEQRGITVADIASRSRKFAAQFERQGKKLRLVIVDHIGLVRSSTRYAGNRVRELAEITDGLATLAKDHDCAVLGLCQLNRAVEKQENKRPGLSDLRESGAIEEDASAVVFLYRPAYYLEIQKFDDQSAELARQDALRNCRHQIEFIIAKNRNGVTGNVSAFVDIGANAIRDLSGDGEIGSLAA